MSEPVNTLLAAIALGLAAVALWRGHTAAQHVRNIRRTIMALIDDMRQELGTINDTTTELAADIDDLLTRIADTGSNEVSAEDVEQLRAMSARLRGVADKHTPGTTPEPPPV